MSIDLQPVTVPPPPDKVSLAQLAREAWDSTEGQYEAAVEWLSETLLASEDLLRGVIADVCWMAIGDEMRRQRARYFPGSTVPQLKETPAERGAKLRAYYERKVRDWMACPLSPGLLLGDATKPQILGQVEIHESMARSNAIKASILSRIADRLPDDISTVSEVLTNDEIQSAVDGEEV